MSWWNWWFDDTRLTHYRPEFAKELKAGGKVKVDPVEAMPIFAVKSTHYDRCAGAKVYHPTGNAAVVIKEKGTPKCTCEHATYEKVIPVEDPIHFGRCDFNTQAAIFCRGFNTVARPDPATLDRFETWRVGWWKERWPDLIRAIRAFDEREYDFEHFLQTVESRKRNMYRRGWQRFHDIRRINVHLELFSKTNEVHYDDPAKVRPRMLFNPSPELKCVGAYYARLMIKALKMVEPGFISGYSETSLGKKMSINIRSNRFSDDNCYSYDGSSHDAHQHLSLIRLVDHSFGPQLLREILNNPHCPHDSSYYGALCDALFRESYNFSCRDGTRGSIVGTVFSGHPTLTTLFNTLRTILYNRFVLEKICGFKPEEYRVWASGDDVIGWTSRPFDGQEFTHALGNEFGPGGLGQVAKDFMQGPLEKHSFLSKRYYADIEAFLPNPDRLYKAGAVKPINNGISVASHALAMCISSSFLPENLHAYTIGRFSSIARRADLAETARAIDEDYGWRLRLENKPVGLCLAAEKDLMASEASRFLASFWGAPENFMRKQNDQVQNTILKLKVKSDGPAPIHVAQQVQNVAARELLDLDAEQRLLEGDEAITRQHVQHLSRQLRGGGLKKQKAVMPRSKNKQSQKKPGPTKKARANPRKLAKLGANALSTRKQLKQAELDYIKCVLRPDLYTAKIPSLFPVPSHLSQWKGTFYSTTNATGCFYVYMYPWCNNSTPINYCNAAGLGEGVGFSTVTQTSYGNPSWTGYAGNFRIVGAWLKLSILTSNMNRQGILNAAYIPYSPNSSAFTFDTIRDQPGCDSYNASEIADVWCRYIPLDPSALAFTTLTGSAPPALVAAVSGAYPNSQVAITYRVVAEIIPAANYTDLLVPTIGPSGSGESALQKIVSAPSSGSGNLEGDSVFNTIVNTARSAVKGAGALMTVFSEAAALMG